MRSRSRLIVLALLLALLLALGAPAASAGAPALASDAVAQTTHFRFHAEPIAAAAARRLAVRADARVQELCQRLAVCGVLTRPIDVYVAEDPERFAAAFPKGSAMAEWAVGVAFVRERRIVLRAYGSSLFSLEETFDHEVSHMLLYAAAPGVALPRWFVEGIAIWHAGESVIERLQAAAGAALTDSLMPLTSLATGFPERGHRVELAYAQSALFVAWLARERGDERLVALMRRLQDGAAFAPAFLASYGEPVGDAERRWAEELADSSSLLMFLRDGTWIWVAMALLFLWAYAVRRRTQHDQLDLMEASDAVDAAWAALEAERREGEDPTLH
jgi:hypothetical protein